MTNAGQDAEVNEVAGTGFGNGKPVSTFTADRALIKKGSDTIELLGRVKVKSTQEQAELQAEKVTFDPQTGKYTAEQNVSLNHQSMKMSVGKKMIAQFGHPKEGVNKMDKWILIGVVASGVAVTTANGPQSRPTIVDRKSNPTITITGDNIEAEPRIKFKLSGNVSYTNVRNNTIIFADTVDGKFRQEKENGKTVDVPDEISLKGIKSIEQTSKVQDIETKTLIKTSSINQSIIDSTSEKFSIPSMINIKRENSASKWNAKGNAAEITLLRKPTKDQNGVKAFILEGAIELDGFRWAEKEVEKDGKTSKVKVKQNFTAKATKLSFNDFGDRQEIRATGNLDFSFAEDEDDASQMMGAKTLIIDMNTKGEVLKFRLSSDGPEKIRTIRPIGKKG